MKMLPNSDVPSHENVTGRRPLLSVTRRPMLVIDRLLPQARQADIDGLAQL